MRLCSRNRDVNPNHNAFFRSLFAGLRWLGPRVRPAFHMPVALIMVAGVGGIYAAIFSWQTEPDFRPVGPVVTAYKGRWIVHRPDWTETNGKWQVQTTFYPHRVEVFSVDTVVLLRSFCFVVLDALPGAPEGITNFDIDRVTLNAVLSFPVHAEAAPIAPRDVVIPVSGGLCQIA